MRNSQGLTAVKWTRRQAWALLSSGTVLMTRAESGLAQEFQVNADCHHKYLETAMGLVVVVMMQLMAASCCTDRRMH